MERTLQRAWLRRGVLACLLWPVSLLYGALAALSRTVWRLGLRRSQSVGVPVIVVGNVIAGGSGKTPVVMAITLHLRARGLRPGVVSRGHGRASTDCIEVLPDSRADQTGDEPLLIARTCAVPVFVAARRVQAASRLLQAHPATDVIVCDDGLQHHQLRRDIEICVFDERGIGNGFLLPAGPLREPWPRAVDLLLRTAATPDIAGLQAGWLVRRQLAGQARRRDGTRVDLSSLTGRPLVAVAGIAKPEAFFDMLRAAGLTPERTVALPDHHDFKTPLPDLASCEIVCTEKDAVKLWESYPQAWAVPLELHIAPEFWTRLDAMLDRLLAESAGTKLSSPHGPQTP